MKSVEFLSEYKEVLMSNIASENMFEDVMSWINARHDDWMDERIRIGLVGDTSSGKSTLINAILGRDILSSSVLPSSGVLVCCTKGAEESIIIHFVDGHTKVLKGKDYSKENLQEYSDERYNSGNCKGVSSIELQSPYLNFGEDVIIIDSPGLNAYGLDAHERITLDTLLPTIDICIYVTTVKVNSDANTLAVLNAVALYNCPIVIVQNKIDSINASPSGDKDKRQVAKEHIERLRRIVDHSSIKQKEMVQIVQLSAINALKNKCAANNAKEKTDDSTVSDSGFEYFIGTLQKQLDDYRPYIESTRLSSLSQSIESLSKEISCSVNAVEIVESPIEMKDYDSMILEIGQCIEFTQSDAEKMMAGIVADIDNLIKKIGKSLNASNARSFISLAEQVIENSNKKVSYYYQSTYEKILKYCAYANIPDRDILTAAPIKDSRKIDVPTHETTKHIKVKKEGLGWAFARIWGAVTFNGDLGYDYVDKRIEEVDVPKAKDQVLKKLENEKQWCNSVISDRKDDVIATCSEIRSQLIAQKESSIKRRNAQIKRETLSNILIKLKELMAHIQIDSINESIEASDDYLYDTQTKLVDINNETFQTLNLANEIKKHQQALTMKELVRHLHLDDYVPVLLGWDENCNNDFNWNAGISDMRIIHLLKDEAPKEKDGVDTCFFVLVNASQIGMEKKKISNLKLADIVEPNDYVVWVVQDFDELLNSDCVDEGLRNMVWLKKTFEFNQRSLIWISNSNPIYNIAFLKWQFQEDKSFNEQQIFIEELKNTYKTFCDEITISTIAKCILKVRA